MKKRVLLFIFLVNCAFAFASPSFNQTSYRWRNDDGNEAAATWKAATNTASVVSFINQPVRLRIQVAQTAEYSGGFNIMPLQYRKNNGAWVSITNTNTNDFYFISSKFVNDFAQTTQQISLGIYINGFFKSRDSNVVVNLGVNSTEIEYSIATTSTYDKTATYNFQIASLNTYSQYPTLTANPSYCNTVAPVVTTNVNYVVGQTALPLTATGTNLLWYTAATGATGSTTAPIPSTTLQGITSYWVSQTLNGCEGLRAEIKVNVSANSATGKSLHFDGVNDYVKVSNPDFSVSNNFTVDFWVKPEKTITLPTEVTGGITGSVGQSYALFPTLIASYALDNTHAGAGVSVGTNGVCVFEHAGGYLPSLLVHAVSITDWTRVTVVYTNKQPSLYINGVLARTGLTSTIAFVHPPTRDIGNSDNVSHSTYGPFQGKLDRIYVLNQSVIPSLTCEPDPNGSNVIASYFFNQGIAGANNSAENFLIDNGGIFNGQLINFALNGAASNWLAASSSTILPTPPANADQTFCSSATVGNLVPATSASINWYNQAIGGTALTNATTLETGAYYVNFTNSNGCKSARTKVVVRQSNITAPTVTTPVIYNQGDTATALTATTGGTGLLWYTTATGGSGSITAPTPSTASVGSTSYWVSSTNGNGCESARVEIVVTINAIIPATHLNFDGANDHVTLPAAAINNLSQGTIQAWVYPTASVLDNQTICAKQKNGINSYAILTIGGSAAPNGRLYYQSKNGASIQSTTSITANQWTHITVTFTNTQSKIYLNGVLNNTASGDFSIPNDNAVTATSIGAWLGDGGGQYFTGNIEEFRVWNSVLNDGDILSLKDCELQSGETSLIAYYKFNQGVDGITNTLITTLNDSVGSANGTLTNFTLTGATSNWKSGSTIITGSSCATLDSEDFDLSKVLKIYPNPSTGIFTVSIKEGASLELHDMLGKVIYANKVKSGNSTIDISNYQSGIYLLNVKTENGSVTKKLIKE